MLNEAVLAAKRAMIAKTAFIANMSQEMRTPLNAIIGLTTLILEDENLPPDIEPNLINVNRADNTLLSIVNDVLDISKIESGKFRLAPVMYDTPSLINDTITLNITRIGEKPIVLTLDIPDDLPIRLYGDDIRVKQVLNNLLSNAIKYTERGSVTLGIKCERAAKATTLL
ncbi:MAG: hypothetical protein LBU73_09430 [Helicobacteraceae bacterium]|jgi:signal transduction histidine kinase|nr:hypothetical protein [Helicobacteraceae bacterium]